MSAIYRDQSSWVEIGPRVLARVVTEPRRYWRGDNGGATYSVVAPNALLAMMAILAAEHGHGSTDDMHELGVREIPEAEAATRMIRGDGEPSTPMTELPMFEVACSEWS